MRNLRIEAFFALLAVLSVPAFGQGRTQWRTAGDIQEGVRGTIVGTVTDVDEARSQLQLTADDDRYNTIRVVTDSVSTTYNGFGGVINGSPEIFTGSAGFANLRVSDRVEVRGTGRSTGVVAAEQVTLLGRPVPAPQTGIGQTRQPTSISTPTASTSTPSGSAADVYARVEGTIRQVNTADNRIVVETDRREIFNIRTASNTPVYYRGDVYQVRNLEVGDRIRVESDGSATTAGSEIRARAIDVIQSRQDRGTGTATISSLSGRVTQIDRASDTVRLDTGRESVRVDLSRAYDASDRRVRAADLQVGDRVDLTGSYAAGTTVFTATGVRLNSPDTAPPDSRDTGTEAGPVSTDYVVATLAGTVTESLQSSPTLGVRDRTTGRVVSVYVIDDFAVRAKSGSYITADRLNVGDSVLIKAYRDPDGNLVAQSIRIR